MAIRLAFERLLAQVPLEPDELGATGRDLALGLHRLQPELEVLEPHDGGLGLDGGTRDQQDLLDAPGRFRREPTDQFGAQAAGALHAHDERAVFDTARPDRGAPHALGSGREPCRDEGPSRPKARQQEASEHVARGARPAPARHIHAGATWLERAERWGHHHAPTPRARPGATAAAASAGGSTASNATASVPSATTPYVSGSLAPTPYTNEASRSRMK
jgi:hypothetical protein